MSLRPPAPNARYEYVRDVETSIAEESPLRVVRRALRGRWRLVLLLAGVLATIGAITGAVVKPAKYVSRGLVRVDQPMTPLVSRRNRPDPIDLEAYIAAQVQLVQSRAVLDTALAQPAVIDAGWPAGDAGLAMLQGALEATRGRRENLIRVSVVHPDPRMAETAVNAVLATLERHSAEAPTEKTARETALVELEAQLLERLDALNGDVLEHSDHYGPEAIERLHAQRVEDLLALDRRLARLHALPAATSEPLVVETETPPAGRGATDPLLQRHIELIATRATLRGRFLPAHPLILGIDREIETVRVRRALQAQVAVSGSSSLEPDAVATGAPPEQMEAPLRAARDRVRSEVEALSMQQMELRALNDRIEADRHRLSETRSQLDELRMTKSNQLGRVAVTVWGERPVLPTYDHRASLAAGGALLGAMTGIGLILFAGLMDRRVRYIDELLRELDGTPVIGVLPDLNTLTGPDARRATDAVHEMRNLLDFEGASDSGTAIVVTGCSRREGRTSIALALGTSFAAAGHRTLLIDGDRMRPQLSRTAATHAGHTMEFLRGAVDRWPLVRMQHDGLWMLPASGNTANVSRATFQDALDAARRRFDVILIDTGPAAECVEAPLLAALADRVIVTVRRAERTAVIGSTLARLRMFAAPVTGVAFNCADRSEWGARQPRDRPDAAPAAFVAPAPESDPDTAPYKFDRGATTESDDPPARRRAA